MFHLFLGDLDKSEFLLHVALKLAQDLQVCKEKLNSNYESDCTSDSAIVTSHS
jgi:hypothetical protein